MEYGAQRSEMAAADLLFYRSGVYDVRGGGGRRCRHYCRSVDGDEHGEVEGEGEGGGLDGGHYGYL